MSRFFMVHCVVCYCLVSWKVWSYIF